MTGSIHPAVEFLGSLIDRTGKAEELFLAVDTADAGIRIDLLDILFLSDRN